MHSPPLLEAAIFFEKCRNEHVTNVSVKKAATFAVQQQTKTKQEERKQNANNTTTNEKPRDADS
jgi:hypothetical protein